MGNTSPTFPKTTKPSKSLALLQVPHSYAVRSHHWQATNHSYASSFGQRTRRLLEEPDPSVGGFCWLWVWVWREKNSLQNKNRSCHISYLQRTSTNMICYELCSSHQQAHQKTTKRFPRKTHTPNQSHVILHPRPIRAWQQLQLRCLRVEDILALMG